MASSETDTQFYVTGGTVPPNTPSYVRRQADEELYQRILAGDFCYVLTPRQMGKSSLMAQTAKRLQMHAESIRSVIIDLTKIGSEKEKASAEQWYYGISHAIVRELRIELNPPLSSWWQEQAMLPSVQRLTEFFELILSKTDSRIVIFVDEIDTTINLPFSDDFFAAIRACYNERATHTQYRRLSFVLLGVASPSDLIKDNSRTPFNIGHRIDLTDFTPQEAAPLAQGFKGNGTEAERILDRVLYWTGGHPYLTQKLCDLLVKSNPGLPNEEQVDQLVHQHFLAADANQSEYNLRFVRDRITRDERKRALLQLYKKIIEGARIVDDPLSQLHTTLKLSGLAVPATGGVLRIRNRIYQEVFTKQWVNGVMPREISRTATVAASLGLLLIGSGIWYTQFLPRPYIEALQTASEDYQVVANVYESLKGIPGYGGKAEELLADYWVRRSVQFQAVGDRDKALWAQLKSLTVLDREVQRRETSHLVGADYAALVSTYRHGSHVDAVAFSPDGKLILTGGGSNPSARLWETASGREVRRFLQQSPIWAVAFSTDKKRILTGSIDGSVRLWDTYTGDLLHELKQASSVTAATFSPDGKLFLIGDKDGTARLWRTDTGTPIGVPLKHDSGVMGVAFSPDGKLIVTGSDKGTARLWRTDTGAPIGVPLKHDSCVMGVAFSPDGKLIVTGSTDGTARVWKTDSGREVTRLLQKSQILAVAFSPDGKLILTGSNDGTARLWEIVSGREATRLLLEAPIWAVAFSPDGKQFLTGDEIGTVRLWRTDAPVPLTDMIKHDNFVTTATFSPDGKLILTDSVGGTAHLWRTDTGASVAAPLKLDGTVTTAAFSPDGKLILTGSAGGTAHLWRTDTGASVAAPLKLDGTVTAAAFSPDGKLILTGSAGGTARLWRTDGGTPVGPKFHHKDSKLSGTHNLQPVIIRVGVRFLDPMITIAAFSPDGALLLTGGDDGIVRVWHTDTGAPVAVIKHGASIKAVAFSPDGALLLTGGDDGTVRLWRTNTGVAVAVIKHGASVKALAFSSDGTRIISRTLFWLHATDLHGEMLNPIRSRRVHEILSGSRFMVRRERQDFNGNLRLLDPHGNQVQVANLSSDTAITIVTLRFDQPTAPPLLGDPTTLLEEWQKRLALTFENGKIGPLDSMPDSGTR